MVVCKFLICLGVWEHKKNQAWSKFPDYLKIAKSNQDLSTLGTKKLNSNQTVFELDIRKIPTRSVSKLRFWNGSQSVNISGESHAP